MAEGIDFVSISIGHGSRGACTNPQVTSNKLHRYGRPRQEVGTISQFVRSASRRDSSGLKHCHAQRLKSVSKKLCGLRVESGQNNRSIDVVEELSAQELERRDGGY